MPLVIHFPSNLMNAGQNLTESRLTQGEILVISTAYLAGLRKVSDNSKLDDIIYSLEQCLTLFLVWS